MKRLLALLMMTFIIVNFFGADLSARQTPWDQHGEREVIGDDHPWGGEEEDGDDPGSANSGIRPGDGGTGSLTLDWIVSRLVFRYFDFDFTYINSGQYRLNDISNGQNDETNTQTVEVNTERN